MPMPKFLSWCKRDRKYLFSHNGIVKKFDSYNQAVKFQRNYLIRNPNLKERKCKCPDMGPAFIDKDKQIKKLREDLDREASLNRKLEDEIKELEKLVSKFEAWLNNPDVTTKIELNKKQFLLKN